ncbi:MAG: TerD family protein [Oscillospiraceae bacterium]|nr:TerD family protein [Oscillospiraceae bacterium]
MSVNLQKGQRIDLRKAGGGFLHRVVAALGWDEAEPHSGLGSFFRRTPVQNIDCDASAFLCQNGKLKGSSDIVSYMKLKHNSGAVRHMGDNLTGAGEGDDEQILIELTELPAAYDRIVIVVNIYQAAARNQHFGMIKNAYIRICDGETGEEMCHYSLSENYDRMTAMIFGELYRKDGAWKFNAIGQPTKDSSIAELATRFA